jgi:hypothetical protein
VVKVVDDAAVMKQVTVTAARLPQTGLSVREQYLSARMLSFPVLSLYGYNVFIKSMTGAT